MTENNMSKDQRFYKVLKDTPIWDIGTILIQNRDEDDEEEYTGYIPISDVFYKVDDTSEYISSVFIETQPEWFQRVYKTTVDGKEVYRQKDEIKEIFNKNFK